MSREWLLRNHLVTIDYLNRNRSSLGRAWDDVLQYCIEVQLASASPNNRVPSVRGRELRLARNYGSSRVEAIDRGFRITGW